MKSNNLPTPKFLEKDSKVGDYHNSYAIKFQIICSLSIQNVLSDIVPNRGFVTVLLQYVLTDV